jgi:rSAM/selenodomain-associated transferase 2
LTNKRYQLSIIIPVFHEMDMIDPVIAHLWGLHFSGQFEVIVVDGDPAGNTLDAVTFRDVKKITASKGRGFQMNAGAAVAKGRILLFLHADTRLGFEALDKILVAMKKKDVAGGAFELGIESNKKAFRIIERAVKIRSRITRIPYGDQAIFLERNFFYKVGGFKEIPIMEDVELMGRVKKTGKKIDILPYPVRTSSRRWEAEGILCCTLRNWILVTLYTVGVSPHRLAKFYRSPEG